MSKRVLRKMRHCPANDHKEESQQENDEPQPMRRSQCERRSAISNDYVIYISEDVNDMKN
jgi:hypothetical protein